MQFRLQSYLKEVKILKLKPIQTLLLLFAQIIFISISDTPVFLQLFLILILATFIFSGVKGFVNLIKAELRIFWLVAFIFLMYTFFEKLPVVGFSQTGFLSSIKLCTRIFLIVGFVSLYFNIFLFDDIIQDLMSFSGKLRKFNFMNRALSIFVMSIFLFDPVFKRTKEEVKGIKRSGDRIRLAKLGSYLFRIFISTLNLADSKFNEYTERLSQSTKTEYKLLPVFIWVIVMIILNTTMILSSEYFLNLKGIF
ncbi:hypothetical protein KAU33_13975 [Candidatus Dependentiae bacterium]|nr:hypothetical protein [Candidatus Dependentiae bacterium]